MPSSSSQVPVFSRAKASLPAITIACLHHQGITTDGAELVRRYADKKFTDVARMLTVSLDLVSGEGMPDYMDEVVRDEYFRNLYKGRVGGYPFSWILEPAKGVWSSKTATPKLATNRKPSGRQSPCYG